MNFTPPPTHSYGPATGGPVPPQMPEADQADKRSQKKPTRKLISKQMRLAGGFCVVAASLAGYLFFFSTAPGNYVVVAKAPIAAGTTVDAKKMLEAVPVADEAVQKTALRASSEEDALKAAAKVDGKRASYPIDAKQQIGEKLFNVEMNIDGELKSNERLLSISANVSRAVAGNLVAGDKVDIYAGRGEGDEGDAELVLADVPIVAVAASESRVEAVGDQQTGESRNSRPEEILPSTPVPGIYVVRVDDADVPKLAAKGSDSEAAAFDLVYRPKSAE